MAAVPAAVAVPIKAEAALAFGKKTARVYVPRIIHVEWKTQMHPLIGAASHAAWCILAKKYKTVRLRGYDKFKEHKRLTGDFMKAWTWEIVSGLIDSDLAALGVTVR
jgi:hypothetical protein